ncbi:MAG TPA: LON peptidase substrate-binding domain-containing protein [Anaeromyxobacteraceae bacterium]|nr:LON peptidase substrate-binding domain-containing protein [Anaeromyxobacteraceae bacterium]
MPDDADYDLDDLRAALAGSCRALKVLPLPGVVVLPGTPTPFHIFEPRYRTLVADALAGDRMVAVATLASEEGASQDRAPIHPIAGAGFIEAEEQLPDGRYHIVVRGLERVRLVEELDNGKPYREFRGEVLEDVYPPAGSAALVRQRQALEACVLRLAEVLPPESGAPQLAELATRTESPSQLADLVAAAVVSEPGPRIAVIEELDLAKRLDLVTGEVASVILMLSRGRTPSA